MSRIGKQPIDLPEGVAVEEKDGLVTVKGPMGTDSQKIHADISVKIDGNTVVVNKGGSEDDKKIGAFHGLYRSLIMNMVTGVSKGFEKELEILGVGYRAIQKDKNIQFHPIRFQQVLE